MADKYAKVWTSILYDQWFVGLTCIERGIWLQLIVIAKQFGDTSRIFQRNFPALASMLGTDRKTLGRVAGKFHDDGKIILAVDKSGAIDITIPKYEYYQEFRSYNDKANKPEVKGKVAEKSQKNPTLTALNSTTQHNTDTTSASADRSVLQKIVDHYNLKTKRNWTLTPERQRMLKARLKTFTIEQLKDAIDGITSRPHNLGQNQTNTVYLDFELIFRNDGQVDKYRQDKVARKQTANKPVDYIPLPEMSDEEKEKTEQARREFLESAKQKGLLKQ